MILASHVLIDDRDWERLGDFLSGRDLCLVREGVRQDLLDEWQHIVDLDARLEDALLIGLIGGTGVGKSTLINALAGAEISRSGDRRPTTDRIVVYLHRDADVPTDVPHVDFGTPFVVHQHAVLTKIILLDFPDYDSAEESHAQILNKYLPHLDVILLVTDEMKYGDRRLYEVLRSMQHDPVNLFLVLNKFDHLCFRYGERASDVAHEMLSGWRRNIEQHAGCTVPDSHAFTLSAASALKTMIADRHPPTAFPLEAGQFAALRQLIEGYQQEKRRRLAKEKNIDARKAHLVRLLQNEGLSPSNTRMLDELQRIITASGHELSAILQTIPSSLFTDRDRRFWRQHRLRTAAHGSTFPISVLLTLFAEIASWRSDRQVRPGAMHQYRTRVERHYQSYFEMTKNLHRRFESELARSAQPQPESIDARGGDHESHWISALGAATSSITENRTEQRRWTRWLQHVPAVGTLVGVVAGKVLTAPPGESPGVLSWLWQGLGALHPWFLLNLALGVILVYALTAAVVWLRQVQLLDSDMLSAEQSIRTAVTNRGRHEMKRLTDRLEAVQQERDFIRGLTNT